MEISRSVRRLTKNMLALVTLSTGVMIAQAATSSPIINALWVNSVASLPSPVTDAPTQLANTVTSAIGATATSLPTT